MPVGAAVQIEGPTGSLTLRGNAARIAVFLSGGIGVTPFRSMVFHAARGKASLQNCSFVLEPATGGCNIPRRAADAGEASVVSKN